MRLKYIKINALHVILKIKMEDISESLLVMVMYQV